MKKAEHNVSELFSTTKSSSNKNSNKKPIATNNHTDVI